MLYQQIKKNLTNLQPSTFLTFLILLYSIVIRLLLIKTLPITNDEGSYFYDSYLIHQHYTPYLDFLTKSLPHIAFISFFTGLFGNTIFAGRIIGIILFSVSYYLIFQIANKLLNRQAALVASATYALYPEIAAFTTYAQTQVTQLFFILWFMYVLIVVEQRTYRMIVLPLAFLLAYISRPTSIILFPIFLYYEGVLVYERKYAITQVLMDIIVFLLLLFLLVIYIYLSISQLLGIQKTLDFFGFEMASQVGGTASSLAMTLLSIIKTAVINIQSLIHTFMIMDFLFVSLVLFFLILIPFLSQGILTFGSIMILVYLFFETIKYTQYFHFAKRIGIAGFFETMFLYLAMYTFFMQTLKSKLGGVQILKYAKSYGLLLIWFLLLTTIYAVWTKFRVPYIIEFLPILALVVGAVYYYFDIAKLLLVRNLFVVAILFICIISPARVFVNFYTGTYHPSIVNEVKRIIEKNSTSEDEVLTASLIFPFVAERKVVANVSHPYWYGYEGFDQKLLTSYMPALPQLESTILQQPPKLIIYDKTTQETFFNPSEKLRWLLQHKYKSIYSKVTSVTNRLQVFIRVD